MIFKSPLRIRLENRRNELLRERMDVTSKKNSVRYCHPEQLVKLVCRERDLTHDINLLESVLRKESDKIL